MLMVLEQDNGLTLALDTATELFDVFKAEHLERSFEKLEDAQENFWMESMAEKHFPRFDW